MVYYGVVEVIIGVGPKVGQFVVGLVQLVHYRGALKVITVVELEEIVALSHDLRSILPRRNFN